MNFMIVDDDIDMAHFILETLKVGGISCDIAESAETAHKLFVLNDYDALIVDAILPGESGISLVRELRMINQHIPVLFCTGANDEFNKKLMWSMGLVCHKPLDESFLMIVRRFIQTFPK